MPGALARSVNELDSEQFQSLYGRWDPFSPAAVASILGSANVRWYIAGGRAARVGAPPRPHADTDVGVRMDDLDELRNALADWHLWEAHEGSLRPLLPGLSLTEGRQQLWARLDARHPWQLDVLLDRSSDESIRLPWERALHTVDGVAYLRPELALLLNARHDRPKDRADLKAAALDPQVRGWLVRTLEQLGYAESARLARQDTTAR
ncbi:MAG: amino acid transporter [Streptosporangiaceae bacterium]